MFNKVTQESIENVSVQAGILVKKFNPLAPAAPDDEDIIGATTGGYSADCKPTFEDYGADIDNVPNNMKELKNITGYDCTLGLTFVTLTEETFALSLGAVDVTSSGTKVIKPRMNLKASDFQDLWFLSETVNDKMIAICLRNALSTDGLSYKTGKNSKGQLTVTLTAHATISDPEKVPMEFYIADVPSGASVLSFDEE